MAAGATGTLGSFFIELSTKGVQEVKKEIDQVGVGLAKDEQQVKSLASAFSSTLPAAAGQAKAVTSEAEGLAAAFAKVVPAVGGVAVAARSAGDEMRRGFAGFGGIVGTIARNFSGLDTTAKGVGASIGKAFVSAGSAIQGAMGFAVGAIQGLVRAGLQGTMEGNQLNYEWMLLARQIATIFKPVLEEVIKTLQRVVDWFRSLSGAQQKSLLQFAGLAAGIALVATGMGTIPGLALIAVTAFGNLGTGIEKIVKGFVTMAGAVLIAKGALMAATGVGLAAGAAFIGAGAAMLAVASKIPKLDGMLKKHDEEDKEDKEDNGPERDKGEKKTGMGGLGAGLAELLGGKGSTGLGGIAGVAAAAGGIRDSNFRWDETGAGRKKKGREELTPAAGGFEDITSTYKRIQISAGQMGSVKPVDHEKAEKDRQDKVVREAFLRLAAVVTGNMKNLIPMQTGSG